MSGEVKQNTSVATGVIATAPTATQSASNPVYNTNAEDTGAEWHNTTSGQIFICKNNTVNDNVWLGQKGTNVARTRGLFMMGQYTASGDTRSIDVFTIDTPSNATDYGDMPASPGALYACAGSDNGTLGRAVVFGGSDNTTYQDTISYTSIESTGTGASFGTFNEGVYGPGACSNGPNDRAVKAGGVKQPWASVNSIQYITVSTTGNATDLSDMTVANYGCSGTSSGTNERGLIATGSSRTSLDYFSINSTSNAADFGDITSAAYCGAFSNGTNERACFAGGSASGTGGNQIDYVTISTLGNGTSFGTLSILTDWTTATSSGSLGDRGLINLGQDYTGSSYQSRVKTVEYVTISTTGNATDFGDCTDLRAACAGASNGMT